MAKEIVALLWELTKEEAAKLPEGTQVLIYNPITSQCKVESIDKRCLARDKHAVPNLKYFSFKEVT